MANENSKDVALADATTDQENASSIGSNFSEVGHKAATDINAEEALAASVVRQTVRAGSHDANIDNLAVQALQNAVETANMVAKQAVRHSDLAIDRQWNVNETDAFAAILAEAVADRLNSQDQK